jgi:ion channel-forming bestrophin family protein
MKFSHLFTLHLSTTIAYRLRRALLVMLLWSSAIAYADYQWDITDMKHTGILNVLGMVLGLLLVFRTNTAYDRWWEGRKLWGQLVNDSRSLAIRLHALPKITPEEKAELGQMVIGFARALKEHLREGIRARQLSLYDHMHVEPVHVPAHIASMIGEHFVRWRNEGRIENIDDVILVVHVRTFMDVAGGCERIRGTPISRSYVAFVRRIIFLYLATVPLGMVEEFKFYTIPVALIITYFMMGIELIAEEVEEPFGRNEEDLLLDDICKNIATSVTEILRGAPEGVTRTMLMRAQGTQQAPTKAAPTPE